MEVTGDAIAQLVHNQFDALPTKRKPQTRKDGVQEWVPLSGIVAQGNHGLHCVALGTGMKCLPESKIPLAKGLVLHDWHAEVVAIRALNMFLLQECLMLARLEKESSNYVRRREANEMMGSDLQPFALRDDVTLHMYCSEAPCGDASMELIIAAQDDDTPWALPPSLPAVSPLLPASLPGATDTDTSTATNDPSPLHGRGYFSLLGVVRTKPSRPDAPPTASKSCSDKLSLHQCTSLLSSITSLLISPSSAYLTSLTLPLSQYSASGCSRAFSDMGRMTVLRERIWDCGYRFQPFRVQTSEVEFAFSRRSRHGGAGVLVPSNVAAVWTPGGEETLIAGVRQGRRQFDPRGASIVSKTGIWRLAVDVAVAIGDTVIQLSLSRRTYGEVKQSDLLHGRNRVKSEVRSEVLRGWVRTRGDDFGLDDVNPRP